MNVVIVSGKFDFIHDGHIDSIIKSAKLGDYLIVITHADSIVARTSKKGFCVVPLVYRLMLLRGLLLDRAILGEVVVGIDPDGTVVKTLRNIKNRFPVDKLIYAKGGDRNVKTMLQCEKDVCKELGIDIIYDIGVLLNSSSKFFDKLKEV